MAEIPAEGGAAGEPKRPGLLFAVIGWDLFLAAALVLLAFSVFGGSREVHGRTVDIPLAVQIFQALAYAALAAALVVISTLMSRRQRWVRRAQVVVLGMHVVLIAGSLAVELVTDESTRNLGVVLGAAVLALLDVLALLVMTERRVARWFNEPGDVPAYVGGLIAFWAAASAAFFVLDVVTQ